MRNQRLYTSSEGTEDSAIRLPFLQNEPELIQRANDVLLEGETSNLMYHQMKRTGGCGGGGDLLLTAQQ